MPRMIAARTRVWWLTWSMVRPAWRRASARSSPMLMPRLRCSFARRATRGMGAVLHDPIITPVSSCRARRGGAGFADCGSAQPCGQFLQGVGEDVIVGPEPLALRADQGGLAQHLEVMGDGGLGEVEERDQFADAHLPGVLAQHVNELQPDGVAEGLGDRGQADRLLALHPGVDGRLAPRFAGGALDLRSQL